MNNINKSKDIINELFKDDEHDKVYRVGVRAAIWSIFFFGPIGALIGLYLGNNYVKSTKYALSRCSELNPHDHIKEKSCQHTIISNLISKLEHSKKSCTDKKCIAKLDNVILKIKSKMK